jgi:hypothetical protein
VVDYSTLDPAVLHVGDPFSLGVAAERGLIGNRPGQARVVATATVDGVTRADTVLYTVTWPAGQLIKVIAAPAGGRTFDFPEIRLAPHGVVVWLNEVVGDAVDVTFDDPTNVGLPPSTICLDFIEAQPLQFGPGPQCGTGKVLVPGLPAPGVVPEGYNPLFWTSQVRQFPEPGIYRYHSTSTGTSGRIIVTTDPDPTALP